MARAKSTSTIVRELPKKRSKKKTEEDPLDRVLSRVSAEPPPAEQIKPATRGKPAFHGMRTARVVTAAGRAAEITFRGERTVVVAAVAEEVETEVVARAARDREAVLVETAEGVPPIIVGVIQTRMPRSISLKGTTVEIEAEHEILLKTGRGALRIREDGDIELVGSRVVAMSRGLFRLVGKMLRLN